MTPNQVLIQKQSEKLIMEQISKIVLKKINGYTKPVKTKHLANKLDIPRPVLVMVLNRLEKENKISFFVPSKKDDNRYFGWIKSQN